MPDSNPWNLGYGPVGSNDPTSQFYTAPTPQAAPLTAPMDSSSAAIQALTAQQAQTAAAAQQAAATKAAQTQTGMEIGAGLGILSAIGSSNAHKYAGLAAAAQTRWSPWTHLGAGQMPAPNNSLGQIAGLTAAGGAMGQGNMGALFKPTVGYGTSQNGAANGSS